MLYYLFDWLDKAFDFPGAGVFQYISFRAAASIVTSLFIMLALGKPFIKWMQNKLGIMDEVRTELGLEGAAQKAKTPTMGGLLILTAIIVPTLLFAKLDNIYVLIMIGTTLWMGLVGFLDDYLKKTRGKAGLPGRYKVIGQVLLGLAVGLLITFHPDINQPLKTTIPFVKNNEFDYTWLVSWMGDWAVDYAWIIYVAIVIFIVTAVSNASNLTDGIDGIATGVAAVNGGALALLAWVSGSRQRRCVGAAGMGERQRHHVVVPEYRLPAQHRRAGSLQHRLCGCHAWFPMVQHPPGGDIHGRHRFAGHRRHHSRLRRTHTQGVVAAGALRHIPC